MILVSFFGCLQTSHGHGAYHDVVKTLREELRTQPDDASLRYKLAAAHAEHEEWRACLTELRLVDRIAPGAHPTGYMRGYALYVVGRFADAKKELDSFLSEKPDHGDALATRGRVLMKMGMPSEAVIDCQRAVDLAVSPNPDLILDLATAYKQAGRAGESSKVIDRGLKTAGDTPSLLLMALELERERGAWDAAISRVDALQKCAPSPEPWMAERASLFTSAGRPGDARQAWLVLREHLRALPSLEQGISANAALLARANSALGESAPQAVSAPPSPIRKDSQTTTP